MKILYKQSLHYIFYSIWTFCTLSYLMFFLFPTFIFSTEIDVKGFVDTYHAVRIKKPNDFISSRTRLRMEMGVQEDNTFLFTSCNAVHNNILSSLSGIELREAFMEYTSESWDFRIGRQIIVWGKAFGIQITDIISPMDYTEFLARDYDDIRMPVDSLKVRILRDSINLEMIWLPVFTPSILPEGDNPWAVKPNMSSDINVTYFQDIIPCRKFCNSEIGGKVSFYFPGVDMAVSSFYTWADLPVMDKSISHDTNNTTNVIIQPHYHRLSFAGLEFSIPFNEFVLRSETAFYYGKHFEPEALSEKLFKKNTINYLIGLDWSPYGNWMITAQFVDNFILDYNELIDNEEHTMVVTLNASKKLLRETLALLTMFYCGINGKELFNRTSTDYALTDAIHVLTGFDIFSGNSDGMFGQFKDNTEVWLKAKYSF